jgi:hypothetical protein
VLRVKLLDAREIFFAVEKWPVHLIEYERALGHAGDDPA